MGERARTQSVGSLPQCAVGRLSDDAVHQQTTMLLEGTYRVVEFVIEHIQCDVPAGVQIGVGVVVETQRRERFPDLGDRAAAVAVTQTRHTGPSRLVSGGLPKLTSQHCLRFRPHTGKRQANPARV